MYTIIFVENFENIKSIKISLITSFSPLDPVWFILVYTTLSLGRFGAIITPSVCMCVRVCVHTRAVDPLQN